MHSSLAPKCFQHAGLDCQIQLQRLGHYCGYVSIPLTHPLAFHSSMDLELSVHGGVTFAQRNDNMWVIGFDCAHAGDGRHSGDPDWKDADFATAETRRLAEQLAAL